MNERKRRAEGSGWCRTGWAAIVTAGLWTSLAAGQSSLYVFGTNVDSDGSKPPHVNAPLNGMLTYTHTGTAFPAGELTITGSVTKSHALSWPSQLRFSIYNTSTGVSGNYSTYNAYHSNNLFTLNNSTWTTLSLNTSDVLAKKDASSLGTIQNGDVLEVRFYESYDDNLGAPKDATWNNVTVKLTRKPPAADGFFQAEAFSGGGAMVGIDTTGSDYDTVIAFWDPNGLLVAVNDDGGAAGGSSYLSLDGLPPGEYYLCCAGKGATFDDGFQAFPLSPGGAGGNLVVNHPAGTENARVHEDSPAWYRVVLMSPVCVGDVDGNRAVDLTDLALLLSNFDATCP